MHCSLLWKPGLYFTLIYSTVESTVKSIPLLLSTVESTVKPCAALSPSTLLRNKCNGQLESSEASSQANFRLNKGKARPQYFQRNISTQKSSRCLPWDGWVLGEGLPAKNDAVCSVWLAARRGGSFRGQGPHFEWAEGAESWASLSAQLSSRPLASLFCTVINTNCTWNPVWTPYSTDFLQTQ